MITTIKTANPASPKTNPERGLFFRKEFPFGTEVPFEGGAVVEVVSVVVTCPGDVGEAGGGVGRLLEFQHLSRNHRRFQLTRA